MRAIVSSEYLKFKYYRKSCILFYHSIVLKAVYYIVISIYHMYHNDFSQLFKIKVRGRFIREYVIHKYHT